MYERLKETVDKTARKIELEPSQIFEEALDFNFLVSSNGELIGGVILLTVGSPWISVDVTSQYVVGEISDYEYKVEISEKSFKTLYDILQQYYDIRIVLGKWFSP